MMHCNQTKLGLIEKRSNLNYDLFDKIREAKLIGWESLIAEKNNDLTTTIYFIPMPLSTISLCSCSLSSL
jgi:hypothetical protein